MQAAQYKTVVALISNKQYLIMKSKRFLITRSWSLIKMSRFSEDRFGQRVFFCVYFCSSQWISALQLVSSLLIASSGCSHFTESFEQKQSNALSSSSVVWCVHCFCLCCISKCGDCAPYPKSVTGLVNGHFLIWPYCSASRGTKASFKLGLIPGLVRFLERYTTSHTFGQTRQILWFLW